MTASLTPALQLSYAALDGDLIVSTALSGIADAKKGEHLDQSADFKRVLGSPVLEFHMRGGGGPPVVGFYFVQPPSLAAQDDSHVIERRRMRRHAAVYSLSASAFMGLPCPKKIAGMLVFAIFDFDAPTRAQGPKALELSRPTGAPPRSFAG